MSAKAICFVTEVALGLGRGTTLTDLLWFIFSLSSFVFLQVIKVCRGAEDFLVLRSRKGFIICFSVSLKT